MNKSAVTNLSKNNSKANTLYSYLTAKDREYHCVYDMCISFLPNCIPRPMR